MTSIAQGPGVARRFRRLFCLGLLLACAGAGGAVSPDALFHDGSAAYRTADYARAAEAFRAAAGQQPAVGTLHNLGNAEWRCGRVGEAIIAWEQALWLNPFDPSSRNNLRLARANVQLEAPELAWYEVSSTWLPPDAWAWITSASLWLVAGAVTLPGILRRRKTGWDQALAAAGLTVLLLTLPAHVGAHTRSRLGFVLAKNAPLRLTPTQDAQAVTRLAAGEPGRVERTRGAYLLIRTSRASGWVLREEFGLVCGR